ncbi:pentapeptide repeat-containing protein [Streptomyces sp. NPDC092296]|uniref:pentapeptide repeat-containing protein n=1 Tax=Streptomyces sp. NPDC092296 TaxID=3366012 RepID=UPI00382B222B
MTETPPSAPRPSAPCSGDDAVALLAEHRELTGVDFSGQDLRAALRGPTSPYTFTKCTFTEANLRRALLPEAVFTDCVLDRADLGGALLEQARFQGGSAAFAKGTDADLTDATFSGTDLANSTWAGALLAGTRFEDCRMVGVRLKGCRGIGYTLARCHLGLAQLSGLDFRGRLLERNNFTEADLSGCDFSEAVLDGCRLAEAELRGARFAGADLRGADLGAPGPEDLVALRGAFVSVTQATALLAALGLHVLPPEG